MDALTRAEKFDRMMKKTDEKDDVEEEILETEDKLGTMKAERKRVGSMYDKETQYKRLKSKLKKKRKKFERLNSEVKKLESELGFDDDSKKSSSSSSSSSSSDSSSSDNSSC
jgi:Fe-S cluster assembly scaffold protein SufB